MWKGLAILKEEIKVEQKTQLKYLCCSQSHEFSGKTNLKTMSFSFSNEINLEKMALCTYWLMLTLAGKSFSACRLYYNIFIPKTLIQYVRLSSSLVSQSYWNNQSLKYVVYLSYFLTNIFYHKIHGFHDFFPTLNLFIRYGLTFVFCTILLAQVKFILISRLCSFKVEWERKKTYEKKWYDTWDFLQNNCGSEWGIAKTCMDNCWSWVMRVSC